MATTTFTQGVKITSDWLNAVDALVYDIFNGATTAGASGTIVTSNGTNLVNTTATYPATTTINQLLYSSAANTITGLATSNSAVLVTDGSGVPSLATTLPSGLTIPSATLSSASLSSPAITGSPTAPTSAYTDSSTAVATTAFVRLIVPAGVIMDYAGSTAPDGWLECDGSAVSRTTYANLFTAISTTWGIGDGSSTFNLPDFRGKHRIGKGTGTVTESVTDANVSVGSDTFTVTSNNTKWITGMAVQLTTTTTLPTGLSLATTYYIIRASATTIKFATTLANAQAGTAIDITAVFGSGTHTVTCTYTARTLGEYGGQEDHAMSLTEMLAHTHGPSSGSFTIGGLSGQAQGWTTPGAANFNTSGATASRGGNAAMNIMGPFGVTMTIIKI